MACQAQTLTFGLQHEPGIRLMRIVTARAAAIHNRSMGVLAVKFGFLVAHEAESAAELLQLKPVVALMHIMAVRAVTGSHRSVYKLHGVLTFVTLAAQPGFPLVSQNKGLFLDFGMLLAGRFVTRAALTVFHRLVDEFKCRLVWMAAAVFSGSGCRALFQNNTHSGNSHQNCGAQADYFIGRAHDRIAPGYIFDPP